MHGRRTAMGIILAMLVGGSLVAGTSADAKPKPKPNLGIAAVLGVPSEVLAGGRFAARVLLGNDGNARSKRAGLTLYLSSLPRKAPGDPVIGRGTAPALDPWQTHAQPVRASIPGSTRRGVYYVVACVNVGKKQHCEAAVGGLEVISPVDGPLTGTLNLFDSGSEGPKTWNRSAQLAISARVSGRGKDTRVVDDGSTYTWLGESTTTIVSPDCTTTQSEEESESSDPNGDWGLSGSARSVDLGSLRLGVAMDYDVIGQITSCGEPALPYFEPRETSLTIDLERVSETAHAITYRVAATWESQGVPSPWEAAQGTLKLELD